LKINYKKITAHKELPIKPYEIVIELSTISSLKLG